MHSRKLTIYGGVDVVVSTTVCDPVRTGSNPVHRPKPKYDRFVSGSPFGRTATWYRDNKESDKVSPTCV